MSALARSVQPPSYDAPVDEGRFTEQQVTLARSLLATYGFNADNNDWPDARRFKLFDRLVLIAMTHTVEAEELGKPLSLSGRVAQCAVELIAQGKPFDPNTIAEVADAEAYLSPSEI